MATISTDPRFRLARALLSSEYVDSSSEGDGGDDSDDEEGGPNAAIDIFAALLEESRTVHGETSLNAALCHYEYGNALFRAVVRKRERTNVKQEEEEDDGKKASAKKESQRELAAAAALKRSAAGDDSNSLRNKRVKTEEVGSVHNKEGLKRDDAEHSEDDGQAENDEDIDDLDLALEMMDVSWSIFWQTANNSTKNEHSDQQKQDQQWALGQEPRVLQAIGELYFLRGEYVNALDTHLRALDCRQEAWNHLKGTHDSSNESDSLTVENLHCQRQLVEAYALVTGALLACPKGEDVVCYLGDDDDDGGASAVAAKGPKKTQGKKLVSANDRLDFAQSHYEMAREGLVEILARHAKMKVAKMELGEENQDMSYLVMMLVGIKNELEDQN